MLGEIGGRADHRHAHVGADAHSDHVLGDGLAEPHACVESLLNNVGETGLDMEFDMNVGEVAQQLL